MANTLRDVAELYRRLLDAAPLARDADDATALLTAHLERTAQVLPEATALTADGQSA